MPVAHRGSVPAPGSWPRCARYTAPMNAITRLACITIVLSSLAACGNKGPLFLPPPVEAPAAEAGDGTAPASDTGEEAQDVPPDAPILPPVEENDGGDTMDATQDDTGGEGAVDGADNDDGDEDGGADADG